MKNKVFYSIRFFFNRIWNILFPCICPHCEYRVLSGSLAICEYCSGIFHAIFNTLPSRERTQLKDFIPGEDAKICNRCGFPIHPGEGDKNKRDALCGQCFDREIYYDNYFFIFNGNPHVKIALNKLKFQGHKYITIYIHHLLNNSNCDLEGYDFWIPVPISGRIQGKRGKNQVVAIFEPLSKKLPLMEIINKRDQLNISNFGRFERFWRVEDSYYIPPKNILKLKGKKILLVDDIGTSGATANFSARLLKDGGAKKVDVMVLYQGMRKGNLAMGSLDFL